MLISYRIQNVFKRITPVMSPLHSSDVLNVSSNSMFNISYESSDISKEIVSGEVFRHQKHLFTLIAMAIFHKHYPVYLLIITICEVGLRKRNGCNDSTSQ